MIDKGIPTAGLLVLVMVAIADHLPLYRQEKSLSGSLRSGKQAAAIMSLIQSARMNGPDPSAYFKDILTRLPTRCVTDIRLRLPHC